MIKKCLVIFIIFQLFTNSLLSFNVNILKINLEDKEWKNIYLNNCQYKILNNQKVIMLKDNEYPFTPNVDLLIHFNYNGNIKNWDPYIGNYNILEKNFIFSQKKKVFGLSSASFQNPKSYLTLEPIANSIFSNKEFLKSFTIEFWLYPSSLSDNQYILQYVSPKFEKNNVSFSEIEIKVFNKRLHWKFYNVFESIQSFLLKNYKKKSLFIESSNLLELEKWSHHALVFNHITGNITYYINGKQDISLEYKKELMKFNFNEKSSLIIGQNLLGYLDEFSINKTAKTHYKPTIFQSTKGTVYSNSKEKNNFHIQPYINKKGFVTSKVYDLKSPYTFLNNFQDSTENFHATNITYEYRIKNHLFQFNEIETITPWQSFNPKNFKSKKISGRYFQWRAILNPDKNGKFTPILKKVSFEFMTDKIPSSPGNLKAFQSENKVILTWNSPLEEDIKSYHIYYGLESGNYFLPKVPIKVNVNNIPNELQLDYSIDFLESGKMYYFSITAIDSNNQESEFSKEVHLFLE